MPYTVARDVCEGIDDCLAVCPTECIVRTGGRVNAKGTSFVEVLGARCIDCGACLAVCPIEGAIVDEWRPALQGAPPGLPCLRCTAVVPDGRRFCPACGTPVAARCAYEDLGLLGEEDLRCLVEQLWAEPGRPYLPGLLWGAEAPLAGRLRRALGPEQERALLGGDTGTAPDAMALQAGRHTAVYYLKLLVARGELHYTGRD